MNQCAFQPDTAQGTALQCPVCLEEDGRVFFEMSQMPINVCVQWPTKQEAIDCPKGDIRLAFCPGCGFIWNKDFDAKLLDYSQEYENSLFFSDLYREYTEGVVRHLIGRYELRGKDVIDIGCGKGDFLFMICEQGGNRGLGFDTSYEQQIDQQRPAAGVKIVRDKYSQDYAGCQADLVCSRYVFEHIENPREFLAVVRQGIGEKNSAVYFEVPNVSLILEKLSVWDIIYEHCSYFSEMSLKRVFRECGFEVLDVYEGYEGQFLAIEAIACARAQKKHWCEESEATAGQVESFVTRSGEELDRWRRTLENLRRANKRAVLWGAGAKGVSFFNMLGVRDQIEYIVDINNRKWGRFVAGTGQQIVEPGFLSEYRPEAVIVANPIYRDEVGRQLREMNIQTQLL